MIQRSKSAHSPITFTLKEEMKDIYICVSTVDFAIHRENNPVDPVAVSLYSL